ncbi:MAG: aspartate carbamoyltransferase [Clostridiales bacterium GWF2_38_85]|nr:MAG: aspartate carbamoyltransferase [Clostridiales bacterium GWF2_38_85]HBL83704.1 aspartate carbamoyltransferase [Clostridiales bacterium]
MRHLLDICDFSEVELNELIATAEDIIVNPAKYSEKCKGKKLATLFFESSTRTRLSFEAAMYELGGHVLGFSSASSSSTTKGESVGDTIRVTGYYADIIAMRHPYAGAPLAAIQKTKVPIINAGDGEHCHPTQTLADLLTIHREKGTLENLTIGLCGDLKYGRTVHSLIAAMARYKGTKFIFISPNELKIPDYIKKTTLKTTNTPWEETDSIEDAIPKLDILYMTRVQGERFLDKAEYERLKNSYIISTDKLQTAKSDLAILHPLPRVNEISVKVDDDPRACYFKQVENGKYIRMALILKLLNEKNYESPISQNKKLINVYKCTNHNCITTITQEIDQIFEVLDEEQGIYCCEYCKKCEVKI